jgi:hypothetical protein
LLTHSELSVFNQQHPLPHQALKGNEAVLQALR